MGAIAGPKRCQPNSWAKRRAALLSHGWRRYLGVPRGWHSTLSGLARMQSALSFSFHTVLKLSINVLNLGNGSDPAPLCDPHGIIGPLWTPIRWASTRFLGPGLEIYSGILCVLMPSEILERRSPPQGCVCLLTDPSIDKLDVLDTLLEVSSVHLVTRFTALIGRRIAERGIS